MLDNITAEVAGVLELNVAVMRDPDARVVRGPRDAAINVPPRIDPDVGKTDLTSTLSRMHVFTPSPTKRGGHRQRLAPETLRQTAEGAHSVELH